MASALSLTLSFYGKSLPQLARIDFSHPLLSHPHHAIHERGALDDTSLTFQWSKAVRALAVLVLRIAEHSASGVKATRDGTDNYYLGGGQRTLAAALDYALTKRPRWLQVFGTDHEGRSLAHRIFVRANPNRKRRGAVVIGPAKALLESGAITIRRNGVAITERSELRALRTALEQEFGGATSYARVSAIQDLPRSKKDFPPLNNKTLHRLIYEEAAHALRDTAIFSAPTEYAKLRSALSDPSYSAVAGKAALRLTHAAAPLTASERLGVLRPEHHEALRVLKARSLITAATPVTSPASALIIEAVAANLGIPLELDPTYPHAVEIVQQIHAHRIEPDLVTLGSAPAAKLLATKGSPYHPLLFLPTLRHQILAHRQVRETPSLAGEFHLLNESTALHVYDALTHRGLISKQDSSLHFCEPWEGLHAVSSGNLHARTVSFFPYTQVALTTLPLQCLEAPSVNGWREMVLFVHERIASSDSTRRALSVAVRHAWLGLHGAGGTLSDTAERFSTRYLLGDILARYTSNIY